MPGSASLPGRLTACLLVVLLLGAAPLAWPAAASPQGGAGVRALALDRLAIQPPAVSLSLTKVAEGLTTPVYVTDPGIGAPRLFVVDKPGLIRVVADGRPRPTPFLDVTSLVEASGGEQGLFSIAFHPNYASNGFFYIAYTRTEPTDAAFPYRNVVARYRVSATDPDRADPTSGQIILEERDPHPGHNGGMLAFGPRDGYLYISLGDGGNGAEHHGNAQDRATLLGKILRIDVNGGSPYAIPPSNPFAGVAGARGEIWAWGLRNPWRFSFDQTTGELFITDVGQQRLEEINVQPATSPGGVNYGWPFLEGELCYAPATCGSDHLDLERPVFQYGRESGCSITGGFVYRGVASPVLQGTYIFGDFCSGRIWGLRRVAGTWFPTLLLDSDRRITSFGEDRAGEIYLTDSNVGAVYRLRATPVAVPAPPLDGGHIGLGAAAPATTWYFAEGYTGTGFDEYLTILNPNPTAAEVRVTYYVTGTTPLPRTLTVPGRSRATVAVHDETQGVGRDKEVSAKVESTNGVGIVVERPIYFTYKERLTGGHTVLGATAPATTWYFAEGYTSYAFDQYLTILNPNPTPTAVTITYYLRYGGVVTRQFTTAANSRTTVAVHELERGVGRGQEVSAKVESVEPVVVERPMYFTYNGAVTGGHAALGATAPRAAWYFAEGFTAPGFDEYLTIMNPNPTPVTLRLTYYRGGAAPLPPITKTVAANSRATVTVHEEAEGVGRNGGQGWPVSALVESIAGGPIVVERPIYFTYGGTIDGGHTTLGATAPRQDWYLAEGYTASSFDEYLTIMNPNATAAPVTITYFLANGATTDKSLTVEPTSRATVAVHDATLGVGRDQAVAAKVTTTHPTGIVVERPMYFVYRS